MFSRQALRAIRSAARTVDRFARALDIPGIENRVTKRTDFSDCPRPVLLLHGFLTGRRTMEVLARRLRRDGYGPFSLDLGGLGGSLSNRGIDDLADLVRTKLERIYGRNPGLGPLTIVGHSKGGLIAAYYVKKLGGWRRTQAVVTLGAPHHGTLRAFLGLPIAPVARSLLQMIPGSPFLARLREGSWPGQVRLVSIWSREDAWAPYPSTVIDTQGLRHLVNVEVAGNHFDLLTSKRIYRAVLGEIRAAEAAAPVMRGKLTGLDGGLRRLEGVAPASRSGTRLRSG
jgi:triacylglycerol esterase/lipase EstA (alpha/beta hydrolase family)